MAITIGLMLALRGDDDGQSDDSGDTGPLRRGDSAGVVHAGLPLPDSPATTPTPAPEPTDAPEPPELPPAPASPAETGAATVPERGEPLPQPEPAGLVRGVALTFYACIGDSTGQYCGTMASGQIVHRGAAACGYAWDLGQRFRILADPFEDMIYTCLDRGGGPYLWVDIWFNDAAGGRTWRNHLPQYVAVELMP